MRKSGILLPVFSLPGPFGIGTFSGEAFIFAEKLKKACQSYWQVLPLSPTGYGDSPYQAFSVFAGNPYFIAPSALCSQGLLTQEECREAYWTGDPILVDYGWLFETRFKTLRKAFKRFCETDGYRSFVRRNAEWLADFGLYTALKNSMGGIAWTEWPDDLKFRDRRALKKAAAGLDEEIRFQYFIQYAFFVQWTELKQYAGRLGVRIIGDMPIYVARDSADAWASPELFLLDKNGDAAAVAGCPPDAFSEDGQLWGNPLYDWDYHKKTEYAWWIRRIAHAKSMYDRIRIDHFRAFADYYAIPAGDKTAANGKWHDGPGIDFFRTVEKHLGKTDLIAEDLGMLSPCVYTLLEETGFPGMKVLQFAFETGDENPYLPQNYDHNCVVYTGTHDNDTTLGWYGKLPDDVRVFAAGHMPGNEITEGFIRMALESRADLAVIPMQDYLGLGSEARINEPATTGKNWRWRMDPGAFTDALAGRIRNLTEASGRR